ncbi:unnamed protein product [Ilex paraguariensis]|uniref:Uncharacterized protein n=1 Tax=Ilex paraguariensis TaxID=185542 RepID=A0ABC8TWT1_9AQUA
MLGIVVLSEKENYSKKYEVGSVDDVDMEQKTLGLKKDLNKYELGFSGFQETISNSRISGDFTAIEEKQCVKEVSMDAFDGDWSKCLVESESFLRNKEKLLLGGAEGELGSGAETHVVKFNDTATSIEILSDSNAKNEGAFEHSSQIVEKMGVLENKETVEKKNDGGSSRCALKMIEVVDDTAVIEIGLVSEVGNGCEKEIGFLGFDKNLERNFNRKNMKQEMDGNMKQETDGKKVKRLRRRGKGEKKGLGMNGTGGDMNLIHMAEAQYVYEKKGDEAKTVYSRREMQAMRYVDMEEQRKKWIEVYCGLGPAVAREYDGLVECQQQHRKKMVPPAILSMCSFSYFDVHFMFLFDILLLKIEYSVINSVVYMQVLLISNIYLSYLEFLSVIILSLLH